MITVIVTFAVHVYWAFKYPQLPTYFMKYLCNYEMELLNSETDINNIFVEICNGLVSRHNCYC